ncbi:proline-, glutamic acid- and leucine-rich protein 1-like [Hyposmocoma kahamanoa]|uniref:proline-, glutamic acid- and leucine-rich protein 1-like n=1 Tax=Hyposmocoma kahamanoa TaxID=1477025 RepID=UPI000E6D5FE1|nr:proline-, glutamic acid- and leucine-rich protein 1-like [Hyposmocoma kahamanoa]
MNQILNKVRDVDPNNSEAIKDALSSFFQNLPKYIDLNCNQWLRSLLDAINRFPKYCMSHRNTIETHLCYFLDSNNYYNVIEAAKCAHALQQVRPSQEKTANPKTCWRDQMVSLCNAAHTLIDATFPHAVDIYKQTEKNDQDQHLATSPLSTALANIKKTTKTSNVNKQSLLCTRLRNVFVYIQAMLVEIYPVAKPIRPQLILNVIVRSLSVSSGVVPVSLTGADVAAIKIQALRSLDALVACLGPNLLPFSPLVFRFVMQTLKWTSERPSGESRKTRVSAYNSLTRWLTTLHTHRVATEHSRSWDDELTSHILNDITPPRKVVELTMSSHPTKHLSKKAKRKLANTILQESSISSHIPAEKNKVPSFDEVNDEVAVAALECAETFLNVCGIFIKPTIYKRFQELLVRECYNSDLYSRSRGMGLLRALDATRKCVPPGVPPPTQYCLQLYSTKINSQHTEISTFCSRALLDIRLHLHCSPPSLNFAIQPQPENRTQEKEKDVSARNRAALESLLGIEKVPKEKEEVITIPDEPLVKKARIEDATDNISVSSESVQSVEVNDDSDVEQSTVPDVELIIENIQDIEPSDEIDEEVPEVIVDDLESERVKIITEGSDAQHVIQEEIIIEENFTRAVSKIKNKIQECEIYATEKINIYEANTQMPSNMDNDTIDGEDRPLSMEVAYDFPNTCKENVPVIGKLEDENLPSTNETDDIQITCGQVVKNSQEVDGRKCVDDKTETTKVNEVNLPDKVVPNGDTPEGNNEISSKLSRNNGLTVDDMLADFVDEVKEDTQVTQA